MPLYGTCGENFAFFFTLPNFWSGICLCISNNG
jgi:hypothetical protein